MTDKEKVLAKWPGTYAYRELMNCYNVGGWTDALAPMQRALKAEAERDALRVAAG